MREPYIRHNRESRESVSPGASSSDSTARNLESAYFSCVRTPRLDRLMYQYNQAIGVGRTPGIGYQNRALVDLTSFEGDVCIVGDLHGVIRNLRRVLQHDGMLEKLARRERALVFLGDLVHGEELQNCDLYRPSLELFKSVMRLKIAFPTQVYVLRGNHDGILSHAIKYGVNQSVRFYRHLVRHVSEEFIAGYISAIDSGPLMALGPGFVGIHAGPIKSASNLSQIIECDMRDLPPAQQSRILFEATWSRKDRETGPSYSQKDIAPFMRLCGVPNGALIVGHSYVPYGWINEVCRNHYVLTASSESVGYMKCQGGLVEPVTIT